VRSGSTYLVVSSCPLSPKISGPGARVRLYHHAVDVLWWIFLGLVHLSETRKNLGVTIATLRDLHRKAFAWFGEGLGL